MNDNKNNNNRKNNRAKGIGFYMILLIIVATLPLFLIVPFEDKIDALSGNLYFVASALIATGFLLFISDRVKPGKKTARNATLKDALLVGLAQAAATCPGISRSGTTITACLACGFKREFAVKYSFIMSIPAILGALVLELLDFSPEMLSGSDMVNYLAGTLVSAVVGYVCIKTMLVIVRGKKFKYFAYYCFAMGAFAVLFSIFA